MKKLALTLVVSASSIGVYGVIPAAADPPSNGCATGNRKGDVDHGILYFSVAEMTALGYHGPEFADDPANGGNGDGYVCGIPLGNLTTPRGSGLRLVRQPAQPSRRVNPEFDHQGTEP